MARRRERGTRLPTPNSNGKPRGHQNQCTHPTTEKGGKEEINESLHAGPGHRWHLRFSHQQDDNKESVAHGHRLSGNTSPNKTQQGKKSRLLFFFFSVWRNHRTDRGDGSRGGGRRPGERTSNRGKHDEGRNVGGINKSNSSPFTEVRWIFFFCNDAGKRVMIKKNPNKIK